MSTASALVTGASRGIGREIARLLASEGFAVTLVARTPGDLALVEEELRAQGAQVQSVSANVANQDDVIRALQAHENAYGSMDVLVNNAGMGIYSKLSDLDQKQIELQLAVNLSAVISMCRQAQPQLAKAAAANGRALVVNVASISGKVGSPSLSVYSAAKHGVVGFTDAMNKELYEEGIRFVALCPGYVDTTLSDYVKRRLSPNEMVQTHDLAEAVRFLLRLSPACLVSELVFLEASALGLKPDLDPAEQQL